MRILLDECVPWPMRTLLAPHECSTVQHRGWQGIRNGDLLQHADDEYDLFLTADQSLRYQQNLAGRRVRVLASSTNNLRRVQAAAALIHAALADLGPGQFRYLEVP